MSLAGHIRMTRFRPIPGRSGGVTMYAADALSGVAMAEGSGVEELVAAAAAGDARAWNDIVERFVPLVRSVIRSFRLSPSDAEDVSQTLWLRLVEHLGDIRDPAALPGWIRSTARNECLTLVRVSQRTTLPGAGLDNTLDASVEAADPGEAMYAQQSHEALLRALAELPDSQRRLLEALLADPPLTYDEISTRLGIPRGSIGPTRARALQNVRASSALSAMVSFDSGARR
jgi:RNA polymerase sigma factor (sigma-70 family)